MPVPLPDPPAKPAPKPKPRPRPRPAPAPPAVAPANAVIAAITQAARHFGIPVEVALSIAYQESGLNAHAVGDGGTSFGLYQLHQGGELGTHSAAWAYNPLNNAMQALSVVAHVRQQHPTWDWGSVAAAAQRPADQIGYASRVNGILHGYQQAGAGNPGRYFSSRAVTTSGGSPGASVSTAGASVNNQAVKPADIAAGLDSLGFAAGLIHSDKSLTAAFNKIISLKLDLSTGAGQARAKQILENTTWFRSRTDSQRKFDELHFADPKEWSAQIGRQEGSLHTMAGQMGVYLNANQLQALAKTTLRNGLTQDQILGAVAQHFTYVPGHGYTGVAGASIDTIKQMAADYFVPTSTTQMQNWVRGALAGTTDPTKLQDLFKQQALSLFPYLKQQLDAGHTVAEVADPYKQMMANTLEVDPNGINNNDPTVMRGLQTKDQAGAMGLMPLWQYQQMLREDPRWLKTQNAQNSLLGAGSSLLKNWGLIG